LSSRSRAVSVSARLLLLASLTLAPSAQAQLLVARGLAATSTGEGDGATAARLSPWAEFQRATTTNREQTGWNYKLGLHAELATLPKRFRLSTQLAHELVATPAGGLGFDPRGAVWSETLRLTSPRVGGWAAAYSLFIRCRHDIDAGLASAPGGVETDAPGGASAGERVIVLSGAQLGVQSPAWRIGARGAVLQITADVEQYGKPIDKRRPTTPNALLWKDAEGALSVTLRAQQPINGRVRAFARVWHSTVRFGGAQTAYRTNARFEGGLHLPGPHGATDLLVAYERTFDDMLLSIPRASRSLFVGVRLTALEIL